VILSRLSRAVREQNWFAVVLEFVIVVSGVLLAFQVSTWSQEAADRAYARDILARLHGELRAISNVRAMTIDRFTEQLQHLIAARPIVMGMVETDELTQDQCSIIASASLYVGNAPDSFPSLDELITSGALESIRSEDLRKAAMELYSKRSAVRTSAAESLNRVTDLAIDYPDAVQRILIPDPEEDDDGWDISAACNLAAMRASKGFQAAFLANFNAYRGRVEFVLLFLDDAIETLREALEAELDLPTEDVAEPAS